MSQQTPEEKPATTTPELPQMQLEQVREAVTKLLQALGPQITGGLRPGNPAPFAVDVSICQSHCV